MLSHPRWTPSHVASRGCPDRSPEDRRRRSLRGSSTCSRASIVGCGSGRSPRASGSRRRQRKPMRAASSASWEPPLAPRPPTPLDAADCSARTPPDAPPAAMPPRPNRRLPDSGPDRDDGTMAATTAGSWVGRSIQRVEDDALLRGEGRFLDDLAPSPTASTRRSSGRCSHTRGSRSMPPRRSRSPASWECSRGRTSPRSRDRSRPESNRGHRSTPQRSTRCGTWESRSPSSSRRIGTRGGRSGARRGGLRPTGAGARSGVGRSGQRRPRPPVRIWGRRRRDGGCRPRPATDVPVSTFHLHSGRMLRRRRRLGRGGRPPDGMGELPGPVHAARRRRSRARIEGRPAAPAHATGLGRLVRDQVGRLLLRRADRARLAPPRGTGDVDRGPARAPRRERGGNGPDDGGGGGLHVRRPADRASLRRDRGRRGIRPRAGARHPLPHARLPLRRLPRLQRGRAQPSRSRPTRSRPASIGASAAPSSTSGSSERWPSPRVASASIRPTSPGAT